MNRSLWVLLFLPFLVRTSSADQTNKLIDCVMYEVPTNTTSGSGYTALECGLDDKIYVGTAHYGESAHLLQFDPRRKLWKDLIDAMKFTRETGTGLDSQSKFHAKIQVDSDGLIWAATKQGNEDFTYRPEFGENPTGYPGGHLFSYNPKTGDVIDHGILRKQEGLMGGAIDRKRRLLYYWSDPKQHFIRYDITHNTVHDFGETGGYPRYITIDPRGRVFGAGRPGILWMFDPGRDQLCDLAVQLDGPGKYEDPYVIVMSADGRKIFGCAISGEYVLEFDLDSIHPGDTDKADGANGTIVCRHPDRSVPAPAKAEDQHAGTLGKDGCFYYTNGGNSGLHLMRYNPGTRKADDLGIIHIKVKGRPDILPTSSQGACVSRDGTLWVMFIQYLKTPYCIVAFDKLTAGRR